LALTVDHPLRGFRFEALIDTLKLKVEVPEGASRRRFRHFLSERLGVSAFVFQRKSGPSAAHRWFVIIQDVSPIVVSLLKSTPDFECVSLSTATPFQVDFALDAYLIKHSDEASDDLRRLALLDALAWHFNFPAHAITADGGGPRWYDQSGRFRIARKFMDRDGLPCGEGVSLKQAATIYVGQRRAPLEYMIQHKTSDRRWGERANNLPNRQRRVRIEARVRGNELAGHAIQSLDDLNGIEVTLAGRFFFRFVCPVVPAPSSQDGLGRIAAEWRARRQAAIFASWGAWAVIERWGTPRAAHGRWCAALRARSPKGKNHRPRGRGEN
jgi:hypothetical protein